MSAIGDIPMIAVPNCLMQDVSRLDPRVHPQERCGAAPGMPRTTPCPRNDSFGRNEYETRSGMGPAREKE